MAISNTSLNPMDTLVQTIGTALSGAKDTDKALAGLVKKGVVSQAQATRVAALFADSSFEAKPAQLKALKSALKQATSSTRPHSVSTDGMRGGNVSGGAQLRVHQVMSQAGDFRADLLFSRNATRELKEAMGPEAMGFFKHYKDLALLDITKAAPSRDLDARIDESTKALMRSISPVDGEGLSPTVKNALHEGVETLKNDLAALRRRPGGPRITERMHQRFRDLMILVARDKDVFIRPNDQELGFDRLQLMSPRETQLEILKDEDPQAYAAVQFQRETYAEIDKKIERAMKRGGLVPSKMRILNRLVNVGTDPVTGEEWVFDLDGQRLSIEDFSEKRKAFFKAQSMLEGRITRTEVPLDQLRHVDEAALQTLLEEQEPAYISLTDDKAKDGQLTRIYPTVWHEGHRVIIEGRFEGIYTDDLINSEGRLIEGTAWTYNPRSGRSHPVEYNPGEREPYITLAQVKEKGKIKEKLFIQLPYFQGEWTSFRQAIRKLANAVPSIEYKKGSSNTCFYFDPKDFAAVRNAVHSLSLSSAALSYTKGYFEELAEADRATAKDNLGFYEAAAIGGFKDKLDGKPVRLLTHQKKALAWLEASGNQGVCALDTGMGKTVTSIAMMQKMIRDGLADGNQNNGRFLFVCPPALRGNLVKEVKRFLTKDASKYLLDHVDILSYGQFVRASGKGEIKGKKWDAEKYAAIFFDEAQAMKNTTAKTTQAALALNHPHKICLTASPMERKFKDLYVLQAIAGNIDLGNRVEGKEARKEMRKFIKRFMERVGGRIVGVKSDPLTQKDLHTWVKRNVFYMEKTDMDEFELPPLHRETEVLRMNKGVEKEYRKAARSIGKVMRGMVSMFRDKGMLQDGVDDKGNAIERVNPLAKDKRIARMFGLKFRETIKALNDLANMPEKVVPGAGYPKLDRAAEIIMDNIDRTEGESRTILYSDDKEFILKSAEELSKEIPGKVHAAALGDAIYLYQNGKQLDNFGDFKLPFRPRSYRQDPNSPIHPQTNRNYKKNEWQQFVLGQILSKDPSIASATLHGQVYNQGQNLQAFDTVIHLDRDTWNSEDMKQRTARAWRQGQQNSVTEYTLDMTYREAKDDFDRTLDSIRKDHQILEGALFDSIVKEAQSTELGEEWYSMPTRHASFMHIDKETLELMTSPYVSRSRPIEWREMHEPANAA